MTSSQRTNDGLLTKKLPCLLPLPRRKWSKIGVLTIAPFFETSLHEDADRRFAQIVIHENYFKSYRNSLFSFRIRRKTFSILNQQAMPSMPFSMTQTIIQNQSLLEKRSSTVIKTKRTESYRGLYISPKIPEYVYSSW